MGVNLLAIPVDTIIPHMYLADGIGTDIRTRTGISVGARLVEMQVQKQAHMWV